MLSVVISTSPGRQADLDCCLQALARQSFTDFEVIVSDDGSEGMQDVLDAHQDKFRRLEYIWRPNYRSISRTRNRGVSAALGDDLVLMNTDVLLNPDGLAAYARTLDQHPLAMLWGYVGCRKRVSAPSQWFPDRRVNWLDFRFFPVSPSRLWISPLFRQAPYKTASGHHFALSRATWEKIGAMDESFLDWGEEDVEYALRGLLKGCSMFLLGDAWAEHLDHPYEEAFHLESPAKLAGKRARIQEMEAVLMQGGLPAGTRVDVLFEDLAGFWAQIQQHYLPSQPDALEDEINRGGPFL
ncbi:MAG: glycosyltransferase family 2 protein [Candidatus Sericytochromatia bacterium]